MHMNRSYADMVYYMLCSNFKLGWVSALEMINNIILQAKQLIYILCFVFRKKKKLKFYVLI